MDKIQQPSPFHRSAWRFWLWLAVMVFVTVGTSLRSIISAIVLLLFGGMGWVVETRTVRPRRSFLRVCLGSALLFLFLVIDVPSEGGYVVLAAITWFVITALGLALTFYYERTEPRPDLPNGG